MDDATVSKLLTLSQLAMSANERQGLVEDLGRIIAFVDVMAEVPTDGVEALSHPLDLEQPLRPDVTRTDSDSAALHACAPEVRNGLFVVPRVLAR